MQRDGFPLLVVVTALLAIGLVGAALAVPGGAESPAADRTVTVDAVGEASAQPNQAVVRVAVTAEGDDPAAVRDDLAAGADALRGNLADAGVAEGDYETTDYRIRESRRHPEERDGPAYEGVHAFEVTLDDPGRVGAVIDAAADADAEIGTVEFTLSDDRRAELRAQAIDAAMTDARAQADAIADSGGLRVSSVATVDAARRDYRPVRYEAAAGGAADDVGTAVEADEVSVAYRVQVTYDATVASA